MSQTGNFFNIKRVSGNVCLTDPFKLRVVSLSKISRQYHRKSYTTQTNVVIMLAIIFSS